MCCKAIMLRAVTIVTPTNIAIVTKSNNIIFNLKIYQTTNLMKTYYEKHSLEYDAKVRCFFISCNICTEIFCKYSTKLIFVNTFCLLRHIMDVKERIIGSMRNTISGSLGEVKGYRGQTKKGKNRLVLRCAIYANTLHILASWDDDKGEVSGRVSNRM